MLPLDSASDSSRRRQRRLGAVDQLESRTLPATFGVVHSLTVAPDETPGDRFVGPADGETAFQAAVIKANSQARPDHFLPSHAGAGQSIIDDQPAMCVVDFGTP